MTPRERRHYDALLGIATTLMALRRFHEYYISPRLGAEIDTLVVSLNTELGRIQRLADEAEKARQGKGA